MEERANEGAGFLPPQPAGPEPELGARPEPPPPPQTYGYPPPAAGQWQPPQHAQQQQPQQWAYPQQQAPDNGSAVAGFVLSIVAGGLLVLSFGLSSLVSLGCAIGGIVLSRKGKQAVAAGVTPKHEGLAQAGYIIGWVSFGLAVLATLLWIVVLIVAITNPEALDEYDSRTITALRSLGG